MSKKAYLVDIRLRTRIIIDTNELGGELDLCIPEHMDIVKQLARDNFEAKLATEFWDNIEDVYPDWEVPYDEETDNLP